MTERRKIPINVGEPAPLLLWEALGHLGQGLPRMLRHPVGLASCVVALAGIAGAAPATAVHLLAGAVMAIVACCLGYLFWYSRFASLNAARGTLCPCCFSRMWQVCCARCREPVPPLALMLDGALMSRCPHCDFRLSDRRGTLLAWCSTCSHTRPSPRRLFAKPTELTVWIDVALPSVRLHGYEVVDRDEHRLVLYDDKAPSGPALLIIRAGHSARIAPVASHLLSRTTVLLLSSAIQDAHRSQLHGHFNPRPLVKVVQPIRDLESEIRRSPARPRESVISG
jgi:hypothetical protein